MQALLKFVVVVAALCSSVHAAVTYETCTLCGANQCPPVKDDAVTLTCDKEFSPGKEYYTKTCVDRVPQHYSVMLYEALSPDDAAHGFAFRKSGYWDKIHRKQVTFTVLSGDGKFQEAYRYISPSQGCDAAFIKPAKVLSVTVQSVVDN